MRTGTAALELDANIAAHDDDGTSRYSIGRPGLEKARAGAEPRATPIRPGNTAAATAATDSRRNQVLRVCPAQAIAAPSARPTR